MKEKNRQEKLHTKLKLVEEIIFIKMVTHNVDVTMVTHNVDVTMVTHNVDVTMVAHNVHTDTYVFFIVNITFTPRSWSVPGATSYLTPIIWCAKTVTGNLLGYVQFKCLHHALLYPL